MEDDRQSRIDKIVRSAYRLEPDKRASYLARVCEDDQVREEVTRTLAILADTPPPPSAPEPSARDVDAIPSEAPPHRDRRIDQTYGVYRVTRRIGSGGMGEVYLASDTRLDRQVALKFLPAQTVSDETILRRFQSEARTASALNHPNILTIFDVGKFGRDHYIASEFVEGVTLRARLRRGPFELSEAVEIVTQVASALVAAHSAGVIHRDLKPTNIMLRPDGYVKVIDFGLAKRIRSVAEASREEGFTHPGTMIGTVDYMSPEQARGEDVDPRTDLWSLGVIFYEMLAGARPFAGQSEYHVVAQILESEPKPLGQAGALPPEVVRILECCLQKDREKRYLSAADLYADLREARRALNLSSITRRSILQQSKPGSKRRLWIGLAAALVASIGLGWWWQSWAQARFLGPEPFEVSQINPITFTGETLGAAISPDGLSLAYVSGTVHHLALYVAQLAGNKVDSASNTKRIPEADVEYQGITFSNDSRTIYFGLRSHNLGTLYKIPVTGGEQQPVLADIDGPVAVNPDSGELAFMRVSDPRSSIIVAGGKRGQEGEPVYTIQGLLGRRVAWTKNSGAIACFRYPDAGHRNFQVQVLRVPASGGPASVRRTVDVAGWGGASQPVWLRNGRDLIMASRSFEESEENMQLREVSTMTGRTRDVTNGLYGYRGASLTAAEDKLVTVRFDRETSFWFASTPDFRDGRVRSGDSGRYESVNWTEGGQLLAQAKRGNGVDIWMIDPGGGEPRIMTDGRSVYREPVWLPHHRSFVLASHREGSSGIWRFDLKDGSYHLLASSHGYLETPSCSPDGERVYYTDWDLNEPSIWVASTGGGRNAPQRLLPDARHPIVSPDGQSMAVEFVDKSTKSGWRVSVVDLGSLDVKASYAQVLAGSRLRWMPDGSGLTFVQTDDQETSNLLLQKLSDPGSPPVPLTDFHENQIFDYAWSPDGKRLVCLKGHVSSDAFLLVRKESWIGSWFAR